MRAGPARLALLAALGLCACGRGEPDAGDSGGPEPALVLYSSLPGQETRALCEAYTAATGVRVEYMVGTPDRLIEAMAAKEYQPGADLLVVAGTRALGHAVDEDVLRPVQPSVAFEAIPRGLRDPDGYWIGLAAEALAIVYRPDRAGAGPISSYADLSSDAYYGELCLRGAEAEASRSLVAALIASLGLRDAEVVVRGWVRNLATPEWRDDISILEALDVGSCGIAIVGSAELAAQQGAQPGSRLAVIWPHDQEVGLQLHPVGAGISRHANAPEAAADLLEWLAGPEGQRTISAAGPYLAALADIQTANLAGSGPARAAGANGPAGNVLQVKDILPLMERARYQPAARGN